MLTRLRLSLYIVSRKGFSLGWPTKLKQLKLTELGNSCLFETKQLEIECFDV